jgi:hypothetical protein
MKSFKLFLFLYGIILLLEFSCVKKPDTNLPDLPLLKTRWVLSYFQNPRTNQIIHYPDSLRINESISFTDSVTLSIAAGCGSGKAGYSIKSDSMIIDPIYGPWTYCSLMQWDDYLVINLEHAYRYIIKANQLIIYSKGTYDLYFVAKPSN